MNQKPEQTERSITSDLTPPLVGDFSKPTDQVTIDTKNLTGDPDATSDDPTGYPGATSPTAPKLVPFEARRFGNYELIAEIARGGMGVVYKAKQVSLNRIVALKMILDGRVASESAIKRFYIEARAAAALDHPNIVPIYDVDEAEGRHFFSMAFIEGSSMKGQIARKGPLDAQAAIRMMLPIVEAVEFAHQRNIIHRDLKPDNILIDAQGRPRVTDFGLAKHLEEGDPGITGAGQILGTPAYMAPEQALGGQRKIGPAADVYALGGILYFLLTGKSPFAGETVTEVLSKVLTERPIQPREINPRIPEALDEVCRVCLEKDPEKRYPSATALREILQGMLENSGPSSGFVAAPPAPITMSAPVMSPPAISSPASMPSGRKIVIVLGIGMIAIALGAAAWRFGGFVVPTINPTEPIPVVSDITAEQEKTALANWTNDFDLKVEFAGQRSTKNNVFRFVKGDLLKIRVESKMDAYVGIWYVDKQGVAMQIFPNEFDKDNRILANKPRIVPSDKAVLEMDTTDGVWEVQVLASSRPWKAPDISAKDGFVVFNSDFEKKILQNTLRTIHVKAVPAGQPIPKVARDILRYQVDAKPGTQPKNSK